MWNLAVYSLAFKSKQPTIQKSTLDLDNAFAHTVLSTKFILLSEYVNMFFILIFNVYFKYKGVSIDQTLMMLLRNTRYEHGDLFLLSAARLAKTLTEDRS